MVGLTQNHKIYSPEPGDRAQARTQMASMAASVESALNAQADNVKKAVQEATRDVLENSQQIVSQQIEQAKQETGQALEEVSRLAESLEEKSFKTLLSPDFGLYSSGANYRSVRAMSTSEVPSMLDDLGAPVTGDRRLLSFVLASSPAPHTVGANFRGSPVGSGAAEPAGGIEVAPVDKWVHYGDSLTHWGTPEALAAMTGYTHVNAGHASDTAAMVAIRAGGTTYEVKLQGGVIPAAGSVSLVGQHPRDLTTGDGMQYPVVIAGVSGYIARSGASTPVTFTRNAPGEPVPAEGWQLVTIDGETPTVKGTLGNRAGYSLIIGVGRNDLIQRREGGNIASVLLNIRKIIEANKAQAKTVIVWDIPPWSFEGAGTNSARYREEWNAAIAAAFPEYFVSISDKLRTPAAFEAVGATMTEQDRADIAKGLTPGTFRRDSAGHFNETGNRAWAHFMLLAMRERGLIRG